VATDRLEDGRDRDLYRRVTARDRDAFEELYRRYAAAAYGLAFRVIGRSALAQDVVHDSFLALWRAPEAFDPAKGTFRAYFLSLVHHRAVDTVRLEERLRQRSRRMNPDRDEDEDIAEDVVHEAWLADRRSKVQEAMAGLSAEQREVLELAYFRGYTQARIAAETGVPLGTVKTRTLAAMRRLRAALMRGPDEDD